MREDLQKKVDRAVNLIRSIVGDDTVEVGYSGGKDSDVILQLTKESGVKYRAIYKNTTIDPPGTIKHALEMGAEVVRPEKTFFQLIEKAGYPSRLRRFCCQKLKEYKYDDSMSKIIIGVRREESTKRANRYQEPTECLGKKDNPYEAIYPLLDWTSKDIEDFIADRGIKCAPVYYDEQGNFRVERRLGCMACPLAYKTHRIAEFKKYPGLVKAYIRAGRKFMDSHKDGKLAQKYGDEYTYFVRNLFFESEEDFDMVANGLFGKPDFKEFIEKQFDIQL